MSNKTLSINPALFTVGGTKTKKNREKKPKVNTVPLISPSVLKNKLLNRIKEHKQKEAKNLENNKQNKVSIPKPNLNQTPDNYSDEFTESLNYLQSLSKQKDINEEKKRNEIIKQKRREELERRTVRNYHTSPEINTSLPVSIDLPEELTIPMPNNNNINESFKLHVKDDVPYGILKGGSKPSFREWTRTQRNNIVTNPNASLIIEGGNLNSSNTARENRLKLLREKIKNKSQETRLESSDPMISENLIKKPEPQTLSIQMPSTVTPSVQIPTVSPSIQQSIQPVTGGKLIGTKHITKKTIKRKYTLGKSQIKRTVGVLIKDRGTRKQILTAQKDLKRKNINDIKTYLRDHNLIKAGSNAPNDVLRKLYESAMLTGEITNTNADTLLHNFSKEDKKL
jgi:hypothetical protein